MNYNHYLVKKTDIMKTSQFKVEDAFDDILNKDSISPTHLTKIKNFSTKVT